MNPSMSLPGVHALSVRHGERKSRGVAVETRRPDEADPLSAAPASAPSSSTFRSLLHVPEDAAFRERRRISASHAIAQYEPAAMFTGSLQRDVAGRKLGQFVIAAMPVDDEDTT